MSRFGTKGRVFFIEEVMFDDTESGLEIIERGTNVFVCVPHLAAKMDRSQIDNILVKMLDDLIDRFHLENYIVWFYTPMMLGWSRELKPAAIVYDCMDQLSAFKDAPPELIEREKQLFAKADLVFTGGRSLYEAKRNEHAAVHAFPSSIDKDHFERALDIDDDIPEQALLEHPRVGFIGVIDERADLDLLAAVAGILPRVNFIMVGPVVKIDESTLPRNANIHYLGQKNYHELPAILAGWDVAIMPFALNESTRYISPTKTPEFLAAGLPVVSTPIADVVDPYGNEGLVRIASTPEEFASFIEAAMKDDRAAHRAKAQKFLRDLSWDNTYRAMSELIADVRDSKEKQRASVGG